MPEALYVGRDRELRLVRAALDDAVAGRGALFVLVGEAGMGKTRLADEIANEAAARDFRVAWGSSWEAGGAPAYWPWRQIARDLGTDLPEAPPPTDAPQERFSFFAAVTQRLHTGARSAPLLLVLDDLHAADGASLALLEFVTRDLRRLPAVVIGTYRPHDARQDEAVWRQLMRIARDGAHLPLRPLGSKEVAALAEHITARPISAAALEAIERRAEGNPLFVRELARLLDGHPSSAIPDDVRATIEARLAAVDDRVRAELSRIAVVGRAAPRHLLADLDDEAVRSGVRAGILDDAEDLRFCHVLYRDVLHDALPPARRAALHAEVAAAYERQAGDAHQEIAHHRLEAAGAIPPEQIAESVLEAARRALEATAFEQTESLVERALRALPGVDGEIETDLWLALGEARVRLYGRSAARDICRRAGEIARERGDTERLARAALVLGLDITPGVVDDELVTLLEEARAALPPDDAPLRARVLGRLAGALQPAGDYTGPIAIAKEAIASAERIGDPETLRAVIVSAAAAMAGVAPPRERLAVNGDLVTLATAAGDVLSALRGHLRLFFDLAELGEMARAKSHIEAYEALAAPIAVSRLRWQPFMLRSMVALLEGRFEDSARHRAEAGKICDDGPQMALGVHELLSAMLRDDYALLDSIEPTVLRHAAATTVGMLLAPAWFARGRLRRGDREGAFRDLEHALRAGHLAESPFLWAWAEIVAAYGERDLVEQAAAQIASRGHDRLFHLDMVPMIFEEPVTRHLGLLAAALGRREEAASLLDDAIARLEAMGAHGFLPRVRRERAALGTSPVRPTGAAFSLRSEGDYVTVESAEGTTRLRATRGLDLLARLVSEPGRERLALELAGGFDEDAGPAVDEAAVSAYRRRLDDLREAEREAEANGDIHRASRAREEIEAIAGELSHSLGLGGRPRRGGSAERARINVQRHIKRAIDAIAEAHPGLARHLRRSVRTGRYCAYEADG